MKHKDYFLQEITTGDYVITALGYGYGISHHKVIDQTNKMIRIETSRSSKLVYSKDVMLIDSALITYKSLVE